MRDRRFAYVGPGCLGRTTGRRMRARVAGHLGRFAQIRRRACQLRQSDLARHLGVSRQWVIAFEKGRRGLDLDTVLRAYEELGLCLNMETVRDTSPDWVAALRKEREQTIPRPVNRPRIRRSREYLDELCERADRRQAKGGKSQPDKTSLAIHAGSSCRHATEG